MKFMVAFCVLAVANAQVGPSGIVSPDGKNIQFDRELANSIALVGPSGIVRKDGNNLQFGADQITLDSFAPIPVAQYVTGQLMGPSGIVREDGNNVQFSQDYADNIVLVGPSGIVKKDGNNVQLRNKRSTGNVKTLVGSSGLMSSTGMTFALPAGVTVSVMGDAGAILSNGQIIQF